jgi:hypothetical protein
MADGHDRPASPQAGDGQTQSSGGYGWLIFGALVLLEACIKLGTGHFLPFLYW